MIEASGFRIIHDFDLRGPHGFLSNFWMSAFMVQGMEFKSGEHYYQAEKAAFDEDYEYVRSAPDAREAKRRGRKIRCREDWEDVKIDVMRMVLEAKFAPDRISEKLFATGNALLVEGNTWGDRIWGMTQTPSGRWAGQNLLGVLLMERRAILQNLR